MPTNPIVPKRNSTAGSATGPSASALLVGELATNTFTGDVFLKLEDNTVANIASANALQTTGGTLTGALTINNGTGVTSIDASGAIEGESLTITGAAQVGSVTFPDGTTQTTAATQSSSFRNFLINGDCRIAQRGTVSLSNPTLMTAYYGGVDRMYFMNSGFSTYAGSLLQSGVNGPSASYAQVARITSSTGSGTVAIGQRIEALNASVLSGKTVTFSFKVYHTYGSTIAMQAQLYRPMSTSDVFSSLSQIDTTKSVGNAPSATWTTLSGTFTIPANDARYGLDVRIIFTGIGAVASSKDFAVSDLQLEVGSAATAFETKPITMELHQCMRYFQPIGELAGNYTTTTAVRGSVRYFAPMRTAPSLSAGTMQAEGPTNIAISSPSLANANYLTATFQGTVTGATAGQAVRINTTTGSSWLSAEL